LKGEKQKPNSFHDNPFAGSPEQVKLDPDKWKLWKKVLE
jgi:hypothetical protein